jgi:hypothetical protein
MEKKTRKASIDDSTTHRGLTGASYDRAGHFESQYNTKGTIPGGYEVVYRV